MDGVITVSQVMKRRLLDSFALDPDRIHVIPFGVELPPAVACRATSENVVCLCVGRMVEKKGPLITLKAFQIAHREYPRLRLEFVGAGPLLSECRRYCREHGIADAVTFHGGKPHSFVMERLAQADIFLLHSVTARNGDSRSDGPRVAGRIHKPRRNSRSGWRRSDRFSGRRTR